MLSRFARLARQWRHGARSLTRGPALLALIGVAFLWAQCHWLLGYGVQVTPDSAAFSDMARNHPVLSDGLLAGPRSPLVPLVLKCLGASERLFIAFQWVVHVAAWAALAALFLRSSRPGALGIVLGLAALLVALMPQVQVWNPYLLSESLSLSLLPLIFLCLPRLLAGTGLRAEVPLIVVLVLGGLVRDVYAYLAASLAVAVFVANGVASRWRRRHWLLLASGLVVYGAADLSAGRGVPGAVDRRWVFPLFNVIGQRVLTDPQRTAYFTAAGMPLDDALRGRTGKWASSDGFAFYQDPELAAARRWVTEDGKKVYVRYLLGHPGYTFGSAWAARRELLHLVPRGLEPYYPTGFTALAPWAFRLEARLAVVLLPLAVALPIAVWRRRRGWPAGDGARGALALASLVPLPVLMMVAYHGDAMEVARHSVPAAVYFRVWVLFVAWLMVTSEGVNTRGRGSRRDEAAPALD